MGEGEKARSLNLERGDLIENGSENGAKITLAGVGTIVLPPGGQIVVQKKGVVFHGKWKATVDTLGMTGLSAMKLTLTECVDGGEGA